MAFQSQRNTPEALKSEIILVAFATWYLFFLVNRVAWEAFQSSCIAGGFGKHKFTPST